MWVGIVGQAYNKTIIKYGDLLNITINSPRLDDIKLGLTASFYITHLGELIVIFNVTVFNNCLIVDGRLVDV